MACGGPAGRGHAPQSIALTARKMIVSSDPQLAPNTAGVSQIVVAGPPPPTDIFFSAPALQNPTHCPSGEKKGPDAPSVPAIGVADSSIEGPEIQLLPVALDGAEHDRPPVW